MKKYALYAVALFFVCLIFNANALSLNQTEASSGLKSILNQAAQNAIKDLSKQGGFTNNPEVKIGLPGRLGSAANMLKNFGFGSQLTQLENSMNAAAEAAVPEAKAMLLNSIKQMTFADAKAIVMGGDQSATAYLEKTNRTQLFNKFLPKVKAITGQTALSTEYNSLLKRASAFGIANDNMTIENYVTNKTLDGLFKVIGEQESYLRNNPQEVAASAAKKIFEALTK